MIDRPARDKLIARLQWVLDGEATLDSLAVEPIETEDESVLTIAEEIQQNRIRLPLSAQDDLSRPSPQGMRMIQQSILLLRTDLQMQSSPLSWLDRVSFGGMFVFIIGVLIDLISQDRLVPAVARPVRIITLIGGSVFMLRLLITYLVALFIQTRHICKVRIFKQNISDLDVQSCWPFRSKEEMNQARSLMQTASAPS